RIGWRLARWESGGEGFPRAVEASDDLRGRERRRPPHRWLGWCSSTRLRATEPSIPALNQRKGARHLYESLTADASLRTDAGVTSSRVAGQTRDTARSDMAR